MEKNAVSAGVSPTGLFNTAEIKILICYILSSINQPVPGQMLANVLHYEGIANCFEVNDAIAMLCSSGQLKVNNIEEDTYIITESGKDIAETLKTTLSYSVKDRAYTAALKMVSRFHNSKDTEITILNEGNKTFINCAAIDKDGPFMSVKLMVTDESQALCIKNKFLDNPAEIYSGIIELLTK